MEKSSHLLKASELLDGGLGHGVLTSNRLDISEWIGILKKILKSQLGNKSSFEMYP